MKIQQNPENTLGSLLSHLKKSQDKKKDKNSKFIVSEQSSFSSADEFKSPKQNNQHSIKDKSPFKRSI